MTRERAPYPRRPFSKWGDRSSDGVPASEAGECADHKEDKGDYEYPAEGFHKQSDSSEYQGEDED